MTPLRFAITSPHQDVKRTYTSKLSFMHGVQIESARNLAASGAFRVPHS